MHVIDKPLKKGLKDTLMSLELHSQALEVDSGRKSYIRNVINKLHREDHNVRFTTKISNGKILVWRVK